MMKKSMIFSTGGVAALLVLGLAVVSLRKGGEEQAGAGQPGTEQSSGDFTSVIESKLVVPAKGGGFEKFAVDSEKSPKYFAVYYSAHWCAPCRVFTPELVKFYDAAKKKGGDFELIFVSSDTSENAMHEYMTEAGMKFPALKYSERDTSPALMKYAGPGIPCLVVLDADGTVLADSFKGSDYLGPEVPMLELRKLLESAS